MILPGKSFGARSLQGGALVLIHATSQLDYAYKCTEEDLLGRDVQIWLVVKLKGSVPQVATVVL